MAKERIVINPEIRFGKPCIKGTRIAVSDILNLIGAGYAIEEIPKEYPGITKQDVIAAIEYACEFMEHPAQALCKS